MSDGGLSDHPVVNIAKHVLDGLSISLAVGAVVKMLPVLAAFASLVWTIIRIYETKTVQRMLASWRMRRAYRQVLKEPIPEILKDTLRDLK